MIDVPSCHIELFTSALSADDVHAVLHEAGYEVGVRPFNKPHMRVPTQLYVIDGEAHTEQALTFCHQLRTEQNEAYTPILFVTPEASSRARLSSLECGADTTLLRPFEPTELLAQVQALVRIKERHDQLSIKAAETQRINQRLQAVNQQIDEELALAGRLQESLLPQSLPHIPQVRFAVHYKPCSHVGGDFYDVFRLDEKHVAFHIADAMGHGVRAGLLTIFVKKGIHAKEISGQSYRLVPPNEVLHRLNRELIEEQLADLPFITMIYALFNYTNGTLQFARAGHPCPLYLPKTGRPILWQIEGSLLGVYETPYLLQTQQLKPGDKLLLYTDGMDAASFERHTVGLASLLAAAEHYRALPIDELVARLASDLFTQTRQNDDLTILGMEMLE